MSRERHNIHAEVLLAAAQRYGDACLANDRAHRAWRRDDVATHEAAGKASADWRAADSDLKSAARAYATRMRRRAK